MIRSIISQSKTCMERKCFVISFFLICGFVFVSFISNIIDNFGKDVMELYYPMKILLLADVGPWFTIFMTFFPVIVIIPSAFSFIFDTDVRENIFLELKITKKKYLTGKLIAVFITTMLIFSVPFIIEIVLNCISFPLSASQNPGGSSIYDASMLESMNTMIFPWLYTKSMTLYAVFGSVLFGVVAGILAMFATALSMLIKIHFKAILFLPIYLLTYLTGCIQYIFPEIKGTEYTNYLSIFGRGKRYLPEYGLVLVLMIAFSIIVINMKGKEDTLN